MDRIYVVKHCSPNSEEGRVLGRFDEEHIDGMFNRIRNAADVPEKGEIVDKTEHHFQREEPNGVANFWVESVKVNEITDRNLVTVAEEVEGVSHPFDPLEDRHE